MKKFFTLAEVAWAFSPTLTCWGRNPNLRILSPRPLRERVSEGRVRGKVKISSPTLTLPQRRGDKVAFTLAEVLITLGIIGVVAALTIPTLISNHKKSVAVQKLKKISSTLLQARTQADVELGRVRPAFEPQNADVALEIFNIYYKPYINFTEIKKGEKGVFGYMQDGTAIYFFKTRNCDSAWGCTYAAACLTHEACNNFDESKITDNPYDLVNGKDSFGLYTDGRIPTDMFKHYTHSQMVNFCKSRNNFESCTALIFEAGWQIPKDYPIKF